MINSSGAISGMGQVLGTNPLAAQDLMQIRGDAYVGAGGLRDPLSMFFGTQLGGRQFQHQDARWENHFTLPQALSPEGTYLGEVVYGLTLYDNEWYTSEMCAPIERSYEITKHWTEIRYEPVFLDRVPHLGVPRTFKQSSSARTVTSIRQGISLEMENGFLFTGMGQQHYVRNLQVIQNGMQNNMNMHIMLALLDVKSNDVRMAFQLGLVPKVMRSLILNRAQAAFALHKSNRAAEVCIMNYRELMNQRQVEPNLFIFARGYEPFFAKMVGEENMSYEKAGPAALARQANTTPWRVRTYQNIALQFCGAFVDSISNYGAAQPVCPLVRRMTFGGYHVMHDPVLEVTGKPTKDMHHRTVYIHNMVHDRMEPITIHQALEACKEYTFVLAEDGTHKLPGDFFGAYAKAHGGRDYLKWGDLPKEFTSQLIRGNDETATPNAQPTFLEAINQRPATRASLEPLVFAKAAGLSSEEVQERVEQAGRLLQDAVGGEAASERMLPEQLRQAVGSEFAQEALPHVLAHVEGVLKSGDVARVEKEVAEPLGALVGPKVKRSSNRYQTAKKTLMGGVEEATGAPVELVTREDIEKRGMVTVDPLSGEPSPDEHVFDRADPLHVSVAEALGVDLAPLEATGDKVGEWGLAKKVDEKGNVEAYPPGARGFHRFTLNSDITYEQLEQIAEGNTGMPFPFNFILARPFKQADGVSAIMMRGGRDTIRCLVAHPAVMVNDRAINQSHVLTFTVYITAIVYNSNAVTVIDNLAYKHTYGGQNVRFFTLDDADALADLDWDVMNERFGEEDSPSIFSLMIPGNRSRLDPVVGLPGYLTNEERNREHRQFESADYYSRKLGWDAMPDPDPMYPNRSAPNRVVIQDHTQHWNPSTKKFDGITIGEGHFGKNVYAGMRRVLEGKEDLLHDKPYEDWQIARVVL